MKQPKTLLLVVIALLPLILVSCLPTGASVSTGWAGTAFRDGTIYVGTKDGSVVAVNSSSHSQQWDYAFNAAIYTTPVVDGDLVYVGTYSGQLYALTTARGVERWVYPRTGSMGAVVGDPVIGNETVYVASSDGSVYALDTTYGDLKWKSESLADKLWTSPVIAGDTLYVSTFDGHIYALSVEIGELLDWSFKSDAGFASSPVVYEDTVFLGSFDRHLYAVAVGSNVSAWRFPREKPAGNWFWASPLVSNGTVYAGCLDGKLYAIEAKTGEELWEFDAGNAIVASPVLMNNLLVVTDESGTVYVFDLNTELEEQAVPLKSVSIGAQVKSSFCGQDGLVYIRGGDESIYVVDIDRGELSWTASLSIK